MKETARYPIGEQDFKSLREAGSIYVDKTSFIRNIVDSGRKYYFLARPRRFGKSLFLSTLQYFFQGERRLFKGLYADTMDWEWDEYPVLHLDLNSDRYAGKGMLEDVLESMFSNWERKYEVDVNLSISCSQRFRKIIETAHEKTGRQVVVLVDEYDKPLVGNLNVEDNFEYYRDQLASLYSNFKSCAPHIRLVFITGVSRFSKLSVFSDLNNLYDLTFDDSFAEICGITKDELPAYFQQGITSLAAKMKRSFRECVSLLKENYDGYRFSPEGGDIYNPWSVLNCMSNQRIDNYWNHTGIPTLVAEVLKRTDADLESIFDTQCTLDALTGLDLKSADPLALLYQTGYLTIKDYMPDINIFTLGIPNKEVRAGLFNVLVPYYVRTKTENTEMVVRKLISSLVVGNPEEFMKNLRIYFAGIPYEMNIESENNFHNCFYILMSLIGVNAQTEVHTSHGRIDILIGTTRFIYIIELKYDSTALVALDQIKEKQYALPFAGDNRKVFLIGVNFSSETRTIKDWQIQLLDGPLPAVGV